jgi:hypothetical protein
MAFTRIALQKLNELLSRKGFIKITSVDDTGITIKYEDRVCAISSYGKVEWFERTHKQKR